MSINPIISSNIDKTDNKRHYRDAKSPVPTDNLTKPFRPKGHLIHDTFISVPKFFIKDIEYDIKAVKDGIKGTANDHQIGRLNDVGIKLAGIGIATYLASKTTDPRARLMEYIGLGTFLGAMSLYPTIAINIPSRIYHGFDIGKEYIDEQGRKKSVLQDGNYIPFDMYQGDYASEDLEAIGDALGIPKEIKNREDVTKEQMRKIAIQNQTLWMWTAGIAVPTLSALICYGLERGISPILSSIRNSKYNSKIENMLNKTNRMDLNINNLRSNNLSNQVNDILKGYTEDILPKAEFNTIIEIITKDLDANTAEGIKLDLENLLLNSKNGIETYTIKEGDSEKIISEIKLIIPENNKDMLYRIFLFEPEELSNILKKYNNELTENQLYNLRKELNEVYSRKIAQQGTNEYLNAYKNKIIETIINEIKNKKIYYIDKKTSEEITNFAKIIGDFKKNESTLNKCQAFKFEQAPETILARYYEKFENSLFKILDIKYKDLKQMKASEQYTKEILDSKINALVQNPQKYEESIKKLTKIISDMEIELNGASENESQIKNLITAIENNYNNTARRLDNLSSENYKNTINKLVKQDVKTLSNSIKTREELFNLLDGTTNNISNDLQGIEYAKANSKGVGSSKNIAISRLIERYQGVKNSFYRIMHTMDVYNRPQLDGEYNKAILKKGKDVLLSASSADYILKFNTVNNPDFYKDIMKTIWKAESNSEEVNGKGYITDLTKQAMGETKDLSSGNVLERFQKYINRFRNILGNNNIDFTKPEHTLNQYALDKYSKSSKTRMSIFNLIGQSPVDMAKQTATKKYNNQKWFRTVAAIFGSIYALTIIAQFGFGKLKNPQNIQR